MPTLVRSEYATFSSVGPLEAVDSHTYGWKVLDYTALRGRTRVGENRPIPGRAGGSASPARMYVEREWDEHQVVLTWRIRGRYDKDGTPYDDPFEGVDLNHQFILDNLVNVLDLRSIVFHDRQSVEWDGDIVIDNWEPRPDPQSGGDVLLAPMTLVIPAGYLEPTGS